MDSEGRWRRPSRWLRVKMLAEDTFARCTRWWRPRIVVGDVDAANGRITLVGEHWSWRRWRWERF